MESGLDSNCAGAEMGVPARGCRVPSDEVAKVSKVGVITFLPFLGLAERSLTLTLAHSRVQTQPHLVRSYHLMCTNSHWLRPGLGRVQALQKPK